MYFNEKQDILEKDPGKMEMKRQEKEDKGQVKIIQDKKGKDDKGKGINRVITF